GGAPRAPAGSRRMSGPVGLIDVAPTLLALTTTAADQVDGASLVPSLASQRAGDRTVYSETLYPRLHFGWSDLASAVDGRYHYVRAPEAELYDMTTDVAERTNLASARDATATALAGRLARPTSGATVAEPAGGDRRV